MHLRHGLFHRAAQSQIGIAGIIGVDAALHANFGGAAVPGLVGAARDFGQVEIIGRAAQIFMRLALGEGAEAAMVAADIGVVDVAGDDIADGVAVHLAGAARRRRRRLRRIRCRGRRRGGRCHPPVARRRVRQRARRRRAGHRLVMRGTYAGAGGGDLAAGAPIFAAGKAVAIGAAQGGGNAGYVQPCGAAAR